MENILEQVAKTCSELDALTAAANVDATGTTAQNAQTNDSTAEQEIDGYAEMGVTNNG